MAVAPQLAGTVIGSRTARHTLELYLDFVCPFSKKQLLGVREHLVPRLDKDLKDDLAIVIRSYPQPWHASSTTTHEAFLAVVKADPAKAWPFAYALMEHQEDYFDMNVRNETPDATKARLAKLAASVQVDEKKVLDLISLTGESLNSGSKVTNELKISVKVGRQNGIHVTPTVLLDGIIDPAVSSSYGANEWSKFVDDKVKA